MSILDQLIPVPGLRETNEVVLDLAIERAWELVRRTDLGRSRAVRTLFALRELPARLVGDRADPAPHSLRLDDLRSTVARPGFQILAEDPPREIAVGAIGKVWRADIPFVHVSSETEFLEFSKEGYVKVAWAIRLAPRPDGRTTLTVEVRVGATDPASWTRFRRYFRLIGPGSRFIRRVILRDLVRGQREARALPGDELLQDAAAQVTRATTIRASADAIWPRLLQMGCRRAGFYSWDVLDNGGTRSAREIHAELQALSVGDVVPATPNGKDGFEVLAMQKDRTLVLGELFDVEAKAQLAFRAERPRKFWHVTWAFVLEPIDEVTTRLVVRARAACSSSERVRLTLTGLAHRFMQRAQLRHLTARVERRLPNSDVRDLLDAARGVAVIASAVVTPFGRRMRSHWGLNAEEAAWPFPGDELVPRPLWGFTHAVVINRSRSEVWPWVAQIGAEKAGFYSYQMLENIAGCEIRNAESVHASWEVRPGDELRLHPKIVGPRVVAVERGRYFVAHVPIDERARAEGRPWTAMSWLFLVEPLGEHRCRVLSRYRAACSEDIRTRLSFGPTILEPISFAMDRRMLLGLKERAEAARLLPARLART